MSLIKIPESIRVDYEAVFQGSLSPRNLRSYNWKTFFVSGGSVEGIDNINNWVDDYMERAGFKYMPNSLRYEERGFFKEEVGPGIIRTFRKLQLAFADNLKKEENRKIKNDPHDYPYIHVRIRPHLLISLRHIDSFWLKDNPLDIA
ncbi:hypothetical protein HY448_00295 [Candidatus Pacearchaeota archaeon]|nr:hypothetical protein [Candidatus Pacearchaeota archaeon]